VQNRDRGQTQDGKPIRDASLIAHLLPTTRARASFQAGVCLIYHQAVKQARGGRHVNQINQTAISTNGCGGRSRAFRPVGTYRRRGHLARFRRDPM
jgi:hypothetical protein